jgi:hypothetical protein
LRGWRRVGLALFVLLAPAALIAQGGADQQRIDFQAALQALAQGEPLLGTWILEGLVAQTEDAAEKALFMAHIAHFHGESGRAGELAREGLEKVEGDSGTRAAWHEQELVRLAGKLRFAEIERERANALRDLLARHYEARGGLDRLKSLDRLTAEGRVVAGDQVLPFRLYRKRPRLYRFELETPEGLQVIASDGARAWVLDSAASGEALPLEDGARERLLREAPFDDLLVRYQKSGIRLLLAGEPDPTRGESHYRIEARLPDGSRRSIHLHPESLLETKRLVWGPGEESPIVMSIDHREFHGLQLPSLQIVETAAGPVEYRLESYDLEAPVSDDLFAPPGKPRPPL